MRSAIALLSIVFVLGSAAPAAGQSAFPGANAKAVMSSSKRKDALIAAEALLASREKAWRSKVKGLPDPFFRSNTPEGIEPEPSAGAASVPRIQRSDLEVLKAVAPQIQPEGTLLIGKEPFLLMRGRRLRVGDQLSVSFEEAVYRISISAIERNSYTLRLNEQELQREFK